MRITPIVLHASARVPALTNAFSDTLAVSSIVVTEDENIVVTTAEPHGLVNGSFLPLSIVDADVPNDIAAVSVLDNGNLQLTLTYDHDLTSPQWNTAARLSGFTDTAMNGLIQLVDLPDLRTIVVKPPHDMEGITLNGSEALLERLENGVIGWHKFQVTGASTLSVSSPEDLGRTYTIRNARVATNIRVAGALSLEVAMQSYVRGYKPGATQEDSQSLNHSWLYVCPLPSVALSKDRNAQSDAVAEITPESEYRQLLVDGFQVFVFLPATQYGGAVGCSDLCHGEILNVILRTFHGLNLPRRELFQADRYVSLMVEHGYALGNYDRATYVHGYIFQSPAYLGQLDAIQPFEWSAINETLGTVSSGIGPGSGGGTIDTTVPVLPIGSVSFRDLEIDIQHDDEPQTLVATVKLE